MTQQTIELALLELTAGSHKVRPAAAAKLLKVTRARIGRAIDRLESEGLVHTVANPHDERSRLVCLTSAGQMRALRMAAR